MKTIELISGKQKAQFTTKSVTFDGKEFFYSNMSDVKNDSEHCVYTFTYDNETKTLPYEAKDAKILNAIFSQVQNLSASKAHTVQTADAQENKTHAVKESMSPTPQTGNTQSNDTQSNDIDSASDRKEDAAAPTEADAQAAPLTETPSSTEENTSKKSESAVEPISWAPGNTESVLDEKTAKKSEKERRKAEKREAKERKKAERTEKKVSETEDTAPTSEKKGKLKKSILVFAIVIAVMAVMALIYFLAFGTSSDSSPTDPSSVESQEYQDIDELRNELINE